MSYLLKKDLSGEDYKIWRYMDFTKFCDLILSEKLHFPSIKSFKDPWECYPPEWMLKWDNWIEVLEKNIYLPKKDIEQACKNLVEQVKFAYLNKDQYAASCWHKNDEENEPFWKLYSDHKTGIAIKTSISSFIKAVKAKNPGSPYQDYLPQKIALVPIIYKDYTDLSCEEGITEICPLQYKRADFAHEKEIRFIVWGEQKRDFSFKLDVDLNTLIEEVIIAPFAEEWFENLVNKFLKSSKIHLEAKKSTMYSAPENTNASNSLTMISKPSRHVVSNVYALFKNENEFQVWHKKVNKILGFPSFGMNAATGFIQLHSCGTVRWSEPIYHPNKDDKRVLSRIPECALNDPHLTLIDMNKAKEKGFFCFDEIEV